MYNFMDLSAICQLLAHLLLYVYYHTKSYNTTIIFSILLMRKLKLRVVMDSVKVYAVVKRLRIRTEVCLTPKPMLFYF